MLEFHKTFFFNVEGECPKSVETDSGENNRPILGFQLSKEELIRVTMFFKIRCP